MFGKSKRNAADKEPLLAEEELEMPTGILKLQQVEGSAKEPSLAEEEEELEMPTGILKLQQVEGSAVAYSAPPLAPEAISSISSGLSFVGKIVGNGRLVIFGHVEGEVHASTVQIGDGAQVEGNIVAEELTIGGRVKGMIHADRVKLNSTAVVEGCIYYRSLAIEENAQFEGMSRTAKRHQYPVTRPSGSPASASRVERRRSEGQRRVRLPQSLSQRSRIGRALPRSIIGSSHRK